MDKEIIINSTPTKVEIALLEDERLVELHQQKSSLKFSVGDIFLGYVHNTMPSLNAAFLNIGFHKDAFLHYTDLGPQLRSLLRWTAQARNGSLSTHLLDHWDYEPEIVKTGKIDQVLQKRTPVLIQVLKEPISTKGPRLSCEITLPGRFLVLIPWSNTISISKKIGSKEEKQRLKVLIESIKPKNFGVIVRTAAEGKRVADLHEEITSLLEKWRVIFEQLNGAKKPIKLLSELSKTNSIIRDMLTENYQRIIANDSTMAADIKEYLAKISPDQAGIVSDYRSRKPIFDTFGVSRQIKSSFGKTYTMKSGAYLVIESTEAMHVIDVNSGPRMRGKDQEATALAVNIESAKEIARQLRLRDIGGLIIIDFIDMRKHDNRQQLLRIMKEAMLTDRAQHTILPLSKFGLMQITRQRVRPAVSVDVEELCVQCKGTGKVLPTLLVTDDIERDIDFIYTNHPRIKLQLHTHPFIEAYLKRNWRKQQRIWYKKYNRWIKIFSDDDQTMTNYKFMDETGEIIRLQ